MIRRSFKLCWTLLWCCLVMVSEGSLKESRERADGPVRVLSSQERQGRNLALPVPRVAEGQDSFGGHDFFTVIAPLDEFGSVLSKCGASLIWPDVLLTAAHCVSSDFGVAQVLAVVNATVFGGFDVTDDLAPTGGERIRYSSSITVHPDFLDSVGGTDIALIHLSEPVLDVTPIPVNTDPDFPAAYSTGTLVGLGITSFAERLSPNVTQIIDLRILRRRECDRFIGLANSNYLLPYPWLCVLADDIGAAPLPGDSGSPLFVDGIQVGLLSWGASSDAKLGLDPEFFTEVSAYADYIEQVICAESAMPPESCSSSGNPGRNRKKVRRRRRRRSRKNSRRSEKRSSKSSSSDETVPPTVGGLSPTNAQCSHAIILSIGVSVDGTTVGASRDDAEVGICSNAPANGVWYVFEGSGNVVVLSTCSYASFDTVLAVFEGDCESGLLRLNFNDDACGLQSELAVGTQEGVLYYVFVGGCLNAMGDFTLELMEPTDAAPRPPNDECVDAVEIQIGSSINGTTSGATFDGVAGNCSSHPAVGVWFSFVGNGNSIIVSTCDYATYNTFVAVFTGDCDSGLQCIDFNDDACGLQSQVIVDTEEGTLYYILVEGFASDIGEFTLKLLEAPPPPVNVQCSDSIMMAVGDTVSGSNAGAPPGSVNLCSSAPASAAWFSFVGTGKTVFVSTCGYSAVPNRILVLTGDCDAGLTCVVVGDEFCTPGSAEFVDTEEGVLYFVVVDNFYDGLITADFTLEIIDIESAQPSNDDCAGAIPLEEGSIETGNAFFATEETIDDCAYNETSDQRGLWYSFQGTGGLFNASTCDSGGGFFSYLYVYTGGCESLECVTLLDENVCGPQALQYWVSFETMLDTVYYVYVYGLVSVFDDFAGFGLEIKEL